jgi:hypothetical protein
MTPRQIYNSEPGRQKWHSEYFGDIRALAALHAVFTEFCFQLPDSEQGVGALTANSRRQGAKEFIDLLTKFHTQEVAKRGPDPRNLTRTDVVETPTRPVPKSV